MLVGVGPSQYPTYQWTTRAKQSSCAASIGIVSFVQDATNHFYIFTLGECFAAPCMDLQFDTEVMLPESVMEPQYRQLEVRLTLPSGDHFCSPNNTQQLGSILFHPTLLL